MSIHICLLIWQGSGLASQLVESPGLTYHCHCSCCMCTGVGLPQVTASTTSRQLQQVIGCVNCGSNNGNNNGAQVSVSQSVSQTSQGGGGGGGGLPFLIPGVPIIGHKRMLKQQQVNVSESGSLFNFELPRPRPRPVGVVRPTPRPITVPSFRPVRFPMIRPGHRRMLKQSVCVDNFASCQSWGRSQCDRPGVADRCPCMCTGTGAAGTQSPITIIGCQNCGNDNGNNNSASVGVSQAAGK
jgi:hypothetical protein